MNSCRVASVVAFGALFVAGVIEACGGDLPKADTSPITMSIAPDGSLPPQVIVGDAAVDPQAIDVQLIQGRAKLSAPPCSRLFIIAAQGAVTAPKEVLHTGDVMVVKFPDEMYVDVENVAIRVIQPFACQLLDKPGPEVFLRRAANARPLTWANGEMRAWMDVTTDASPDLYIGRLEGTAPVAEHRHEHSTEILVALEAAGTFTLDGKERRVGRRDIVTIPMNALHSWKPDPGSKLVAVQLYAPPGPEQRFIGLDQADKDPKDAGVSIVLRPDAGPNCAPPYTVDAHGVKHFRVECLR